MGPVDGSTVAFVVRALVGLVVVDSTRVVNDVFIVAGSRDIVGSLEGGVVGFAIGASFVSAADDFGEVGVELSFRDGRPVFAVRPLVGLVVGNGVMVEDAVSNMVDCWRNLDALVEAVSET